MRDDIPPEWRREEIRRTDTQCSSSDITNKIIRTNNQDNQEDGDCSWAPFIKHYSRESVI